MAWRVTPEEVSTVIDEYDEDVDLTPMILAANALTDKVSSADSDSVLTTALLKEIERHLAAHVYHATIPQLADETTDKASGKTTPLYGKGSLDGNDHGKLAMTLDITGYLATINEGRKKATAGWLGTRVSAQTDYVDRD